MYYAYLDESGTVTPFRESECFLVVAIVVGTQGAARFLNYQVKKVRQRTRAHIGEELKASLATHKQRERLLKRIASGDIAIIAVILDKRYICKQPEDPEDWYRQAVSRAVCLCAERWPELRLVADKRYTRARLRDRLEKAIWEKLQELGYAAVKIEQVDSRTCLGLQAVDFVAWSIAEKYERGGSKYYNLIQHKIVVEEILEAK